MRTTFIIYFDGGTIGHNGDNTDGYGSWEVEWNGFSKKVSRLEFKADVFGMKITNNVAEYLSLYHALEWLKSVQNKLEYNVLIRGDSQIILYQINGNQKTKVPHLKIWRDKCAQILLGFHAFDVEWRKRFHSVQRFGH